MKIPPTYGGKNFDPPLENSTRNGWSLKGRKENILIREKAATRWQALWIIVKDMIKLKHRNNFRFFALTFSSSFSSCCDSTRAFICGFSGGLHEQTIGQSNRKPQKSPNVEGRVAQPIKSASNLLSSVLVELLQFKMLIRNILDKLEQIFFYNEDWKHLNLLLASYR